MHQDIHNFSEALDIDTSQKLVVSLRLKKHGRTKSSTTLNGFVVDVDNVTFELDLLSDIKLVIDLLEFDEGTSGVEIEALTVNGHEVLPKYQHLSSSANAYHDKVGLWEFAIPSNFYAWYHTVSGQGWVA